MRSRSIALGGLFRQLGLGDQRHDVVQEGDRVETYGPITVVLDDD